jgi:DNA-binding MarR family transcriptional regulator
MHPAVLPDPEDSVALAGALRPALLRVTRRLRQEANKEGLSALDALLLGEIKRKPGIGVCDLADQEQISRPTMSGHVKRFEASGWIVRAGNARDGRRSGLSITPAGAKALEAIRRRRNDWLAVRLEKLPPDARRDLAAAAGPLLQLLAVAP